MTFAFRIRFRIPVGQRIEHDEPELVLREGHERRVSIRPLNADLSVKEAREFALRGFGYATAEDATEDGQRWVGAMILGFVAEFLPADFEMRAPRGGFFQGMLDSISAGQEVAAYNDDPGLLVVPEYPPPTFGRMRADVIAGRNANGTVNAIKDAYDAELVPNSRTQLAFEMFSAAENMPPGDTDSRFLMLMIAVEALIDPGDRPVSQVAVIDHLRAHLDSMSGTAVDDANSLRGALGQLKHESIGSAGRRLARSLGERTYLELSPDKFFTRCYTARSNLVHGSVERPEVEIIQSFIGPLRFFVRGLIRESAGADWPHPRA
jgi:hypothetical protein